MRQGRGCAGERHGRAEEAERGGRNGAEGEEVRHGEDKRLLVDSVGC